MPVNGTAAATAGIGALLLYSGIRGISVLTALQGIVQGKTPTTLPQTTGISGTPPSEAGAAGDLIAGAVGQGGGASPGFSQSFGNTASHAALLAEATLHGWGSGAQWTALDAIEMQEAGYDSTAKNPSSGAFGLAQSLGHKYSGGPAPNGVNEYGGEGLSPAESEAASMGDPVPQAKWMCNYIASRYGTPVVAEQFHLKNNWY